MPKKVALLIGVSQYETGLPPLLAAPNDVEAMQRVLQNPKIGGFDEVETLIDPEGHLPIEWNWGEEGWDLYYGENWGLFSVIASRLVKCSI